jgi:hypothetical protein
MSLTAIALESLKMSSVSSFFKRPSTIDKLEIINNYKAIFINSNNRSKQLEKLHLLYFLK